MWLSNIQMNYLRVNSIDEYESQLMGYNIIGNKIVYLTESDLCIVRVGNKFKKESTKIKGSSILNFVISRRGYLAFLYKNRTIEIRRMDCLHEIVHRFNNVTLFADGTYPKMKWDYDQLYLIYPENIEILDLKTKGRRGYTDIVVDYENEKMMDMVIANIMDSERAVILQLANRLIFTIIPIPVAELEIPFINCILNLYSPSHLNDSRREYIAILSNGNLLKIINLLNLKQICEIDLEPKSNQFLEMESDSNHQCILIRYVSSSTLEITKNVIYKINSAFYYCQNYDYYGEREPFFIYKFQIPINQNLTLFPMTVEELNSQVFDYYHLVFFKKGHLYSVFQFIPHNYSQTPTELKYRAKPQSKEVEEWKEIISTYLELTSAEIPKSQRNLNFAEQERQLQEYNIIKNQFDSIIGKFTAKINEESKVRTLNEKTIQDQWSQYMAKIAKERNFMLQTMKLFKIEPQVIRKNHLDKQQHKQKTDMQRESKQIAMSKQLQSCIRDMESRQQRIDAKIKQKKMETEVEKKGKAQTTKEEIQKYQEDYEKFVAQFMLENERKQREEKQKMAKKQNTSTQALQQRLVLTLPTLNEEEKRLINSYATDNLNLSANNHSLSVDQEGASHLQSENTEHPHRLQWIQMEQILRNIEQKIHPIIGKLDPLIDRLKNVEAEGLMRIKKNQQIIKSKCSLNLEQMVKNCCKKMLSNLNSKIKKQIETTTRQIYRLEDKNKTYYEESIQKFKEYIQFQIQNRIDVYYKSRKRLQMKILEMTKQLSAPPSSQKQQL